MSYVITRNQGEAIYRQISRILEQEIREHCQAGDYLPSETNLAKQFSVNRHTIRRAVDELVAMGMVERRHGKGMAVLSQMIDYPIRKQTRFTRTIHNLGKTTDSQLQKKMLLTARGGIADQLQIQPGSSVIWLETLRLVESIPMSIISHFLPYVGLEIIYEEYQGGSLHQLLEDKGVLLRRKMSLISAQLPRGEDASLLQMPRNQPILRVKSVNVEIPTNLPVEYAVVRTRADRVQLHVEL